MKTSVLYLVTSFSTPNVSAWTRRLLPQSGLHTTTCTPFPLSASPSGTDESTPPQVVNQTDSKSCSPDTASPTSSSYGVSFIGGDPCGSKYNDDPFDANAPDNSKPGFPDDMKARIAAMAAERIQREKD
eukprot:CAMPEP_0113320646 /NCGR_PEP_ID=MMETSP0010_2-20120614/14390_1 /TAXON_ID=216773 ORGANISM="Corethron hystrix, Strain 308" /NCGR_SAMPLE_ID=MMETSP0010_2 /ASSEMBLY_ACC=CAM_ASM_000155 /LENGTH=128 /DNA_ID=CAMNT_0000178507 /DNA_START=84 /DNA_END=470 /DNA_ORIENTATION=+ /assembly_acc=CAM_ASM_000155